MRESTSAVVGEDGTIVGGNASDRALLSWLSKDTLKDKVDTTLQKEVLFNSERKFSACQLKLGKNRPSLFGKSNNNSNEITLVKGAPDLLLPKCRFFYGEDGQLEKLNNLDSITDKINDVSQGGIRVIAIATSETHLDDETHAMPETLTLVCID